MATTDKYDYTKTAVKKKQNDAPLDLQTYTPSNEPFVYEPGQNVLDVLRQNKLKQAELVNQEANAKRNAKIAAFSDFARALSNLAGGGNAPVQQFRPSPYLQNSFAMIDNLRNEKLRSQDYYNKLYQTASQSDLAQQYKQYNDKVTARHKIGIESVNNANKAEIEKFRANTSEISQTIDDPRKIKAEQEFKNKQLSIQQQNANANTARANKYVQNGGSKTNKEPFLTFKKDGQEIALTKSQASQIVTDVVARYPNIDKVDETKLTPLEREIKDDLANLNRAFSSANTQMGDNQLRMVAQKYLNADKAGEFRYIYQSPVNNVQQPMQQPVNTAPVKPQSKTGTFFQDNAPVKSGNLVEKKSAMPSLLPKQ